MAHVPDNRPVVGLFEEGTGADKAAREIRADGTRAGVTSGTAVAEGRVGRHLWHGLVVGMLIALPFAIALPLIAWVRSGEGMSSLLFALPILFVGAFLGVLIQATRRDGKSMAKRTRAKVVVTEPSLDQSATGRATTIINQEGGDIIDKPKPGAGITE